MKKRKASEFLTVVFFLGILTTLMLYIGISTLFMNPEDLPDSYHAYSEKENGLLIYNSVLYQDDAIASFIRETDYLLFHHIDSTNVLMGKPGWLFEIEVAEPLRGLGFGTRIFPDFLSFLEDELGLIEAGLQVSADNVPAVRLYEKNGFYTTVALKYYGLVL